jgi:hypothetical protein
MKYSNFRRLCERDMRLSGTLLTNALLNPVQFTCRLADVQHKETKFGEKRKREKEYLADR